MDSGPEPTLPEGTDVKKGESPNMNPSRVHAGGERKTSTSEERANWGILVSSLVETITVLESSGSICNRPMKNLKIKICKSQKKYLKISCSTGFIIYKLSFNRKPYEF